MLTIVEVRDSTIREWDDIWESCEASTYYHSRGWAEIWQSYSKGRIRPLPKTFYFSDGTKALVPFSILSYYGGIVKRYSLAGPPAGSLPNYGNWLSTDRLNGDHVAVLAQYLINNYRNLVWRLNPFDDNSNLIAINSGFSQRKSFVSYMIDLKQGEEIIYSNMEQSCRNKIKQGIKNKLKIREATGIDEWRKYFEIYRDTIERWGSKTLYVLNWKFFELLSHVDNKYCKLWLTWHGNIPIAGSICFYSHRKVMVWHSASLTDYLSLRPVNLARYEIIKNGIYNGYHWIDFETAGGNKGLKKFKKSFGTVEKMSDRITVWNPVIHYIKKMLYRK
jgi:hypothetical protein